MSSQEKPRPYVGYHETEVEISVEELRRAGWVWRGEPDESQTWDGALVIVEKWHDDNHEGVFRFCSESPCRELENVRGYR